MVFAYLSGAFIQGGYFLSKTPRYTDAALLVRGVILDIEEEYRKDGFPENDVLNKTCDLPRETDDRFTCDYDMEKLDVDAGMLAEMASGVLEQLMGGVGEQGSVLQAFSALSVLFVQGNVPLHPLCPATPGEFLQMCQVNLAALERNVMGMVHFFPQIIVQASQQTRKLRVRIQFDKEKEPILQVETFIISIPEELEALGKEGVIPGQDPGQPTNIPGATAPKTGQPQKGAAPR